MSRTATSRVSGALGEAVLASLEPTAVQEATGSLVGEMLRRHGLTPDDVISMIIASPPDATAFPAAAVRAAGYRGIPLLGVVSATGRGDRIEILMHVQRSGSP